MKYSQMQNKTNWDHEKCRYANDDLPSISFNCSLTWKKCGWFTTIFASLLWRRGSSDHQIRRVATILEISIGSRKSLLFQFIHCKINRPYNWLIDDTKEFRWSTSMKWMQRKSWRASCKHGANMAYTWRVLFYLFYFFRRRHIPLRVSFLFIIFFHHHQRHAAIDNCCDELFDAISYTHILFEYKCIFMCRMRVKII